MSPDSEQALQKRIAKLLAQNNRLREVVESFSSRFQLQREMSIQTPADARIDVFEEFSPYRSFRPRSWDILVRRRALVPTTEIVQPRIPFVQHPWRQLRA